VVLNDEASQSASRDREEGRKEGGAQDLNTFQDERETERKERAAAMYKEGKKDGP